MAKLSPEEIALMEDAHAFQDQPVQNAQSEPPPEPVATVAGQQGHVMRDEVCWCGKAHGMLEGRRAPGAG